MKVESIISLYGEKLEKMAIAQFMADPDLLKKVSFIKISEIRRDDEIEMTVKCPMCGTEFPYNYSSTAMCPTCHHAPHASSSRYGTCYMVTKEAENIRMPAGEQLVSFMDEKNDLISATYNVDAVYTVSTKSISTKAKLTSIAYFREDAYDFFTVKHTYKGSTFSRSRSERGMWNHFSTRRYYSSVPKIPDATITWTKLHGVSDADSVVQYYNKLKTAKATPTDLDMSKMKKLDYDSIINIMRKRLIVAVSTTEDKMKNHRTMYCYCCRCETEFLDERDKSYYNPVKCPNCGHEAHPSRPNAIGLGHHPLRSDISKLAFIQQYRGDTVENGIIYRVVNGNLVCYLDANNVPIFDLDERTEYCVLFDLSSKRFTAYENSGGMGYEPSDLRDMPIIEPVIDAEAGTPAAYCAADLIAAANLRESLVGMRELTLRKYLELYARYPIVEAMAKAGFAEFIGRIVTGPRTSDLYLWAKDAFKGAKRIEDVYGLPKRIIKGAKEFLVRDVKEIKDVQKIYNADNASSSEDIVYLKKNRCNVNSLLEIMRMIPGMTVRRIVEYIEGVRVHQCCPPQISMDLWCDYLRTCISIGTDVNEKSVRYPNSLKREHDKVIARLSFIRNEELERRFMEQVTRYQDLFGSSSDRFLIRAPLSMQELFEEGRLLSHSVGSYSDVISQGKTCIMFIRDLKNPDDPFLTVEIDEEKMAVPQIRGFSNRLIDEETETDVVEFIVAWAHKKKLDVDPSLKTSRKVLKQLKDSGRIYRILKSDKEDETDEDDASVA